MGGRRRTRAGETKSPTEQLKASKSKDGMPEKKRNPPGRRWRPRRKDREWRSRLKVDPLSGPVHRQRTNDLGSVDCQLKPDQIIDLKLDLLRTIIAGIERFLLRFFLRAMRTLVLGDLFTTAVIDEKMIGMRAISQSRLLKNHQHHHRSDEEEGGQAADHDCAER